MSDDRHKVAGDANAQNTYTPLDCLHTFSQNVDTIFQRISNFTIRRVGGDDVHIQLNGYRQSKLHLLN